MGFRFRRSVRLTKGTRLNISKSGVGISTGVRGIRIGAGPRGTHSSVGIPGTGLHYRTERAWSPAKQKPRTVNVSPALAASPVFPSLSAAGLAPSRTWLFVVGSVVAIALVDAPIGVLLAMCIAAGGYLQTKTRSARLSSAYRQATAYAARGDFSSAIEVLTPLGADSPTPGMALALAQAYFHLQDYPQAAAYFARVESLGGILDRDAAIRHAIALGSPGSMAEALRVLERIPGILADDVQRIGLMGSCLVGLGHPSQAIEVLRKAPLLKRKPDPHLTMVRHELGRAYLALGDLRDALTYFRRVYADAPDFPEISKTIQCVEDTLRSHEPQRATGRSPKTRPRQDRR